MIRPPPIEPPLVSFCDAAVRSGERLLFLATTWAIYPGEHWAIVGPNGSGKSLLAAALAGRAPLAQGTLSHRLAEGMIHAHELGARHSRRSHVVLLSHADERALAMRHAGYHQARWNASEAEQGPSVDGLLSRHSVEAINPFEVLPEPKDEAVFENLRQDVIGMFGLSPLLHRRVKQLSHGETRKLLLARAVLRGPRLLVLDDPLAGLDVDFRSEMLGILEQLARGGTALVITAAREEALPACMTHILRVNDCKVVAQERMTVGSEVGKAQGRLSSSLAPASRGEGEAMVEMRSVTVRYGETTILDRVDFTLRKGEHWALLGRNGAGKSTLLSLLLADNPQAYANQVWLFGRQRGSGESIWDIKARTGWVAPELLAHYPPSWRCIDVVLSGFHASLGLYQDCTAQETKRGRQVLATLGLETSADQPLLELSQGLQRLVLLARALVANPELLVLDEPCQGLDAIHTQRVTSAVNRVASEGRASVIYVTHHEEELPACITHVLRLENGRSCARNRT
ncbi:MAG TPA: ATP-binding cassette domain-containing protein [Polyangia bacterium]